MIDKEIDAYLNAVHRELGDHPEKADIILELNAHIWDFANNISRNSKISIEEAFSIAISSMETPENLAKAFHNERAQGSKQWIEPRSEIPEIKLMQQDFRYLTIVGIFASIIILMIISRFNKSSISNFKVTNIVLNIIQFGILIILLLAYLYYRNEKEYKMQIQKLKTKFEKMQKDTKMQDELKNNLESLGKHISGIFGLIWGTFWIIWLIYISYIAKWGLFNDYWYSIVLIVSLVLSFIEILQAIAKIIVGEIRVSRLINANVMFFTFLTLVVYLIFYPFQLESWLPTITHPIGKFFANIILMFSSDPDYHMKLFLGFAAITSLFDALYNLRKYGKWSSSELRSLTIKKEKI